MSNQPLARRGFVAHLSALGALVGLPLHATGAAERPEVPEVTDPWMARVRGRHRVVFHSHEPAQGTAIRWAQTFLDTQKTEYGIREDDTTVIVGLNGKAIGWFFDETLWAKYAMIGELLGAPGTRNPQAEALATLARRGVLLLACNNSIRAAGSRFLPEAQRASAETRDAFAAEVRAHLLPGVQVVPAMIVTLQQAQDRGCRYVYAGG